MESDDNGASWFVRGNGHEFVLFGTLQKTQTISLAIVTPNPAPLGSTTTLSATASSGLAVALGAGPANVCALSGTTLSFAGLGTCTVTADQAGDATYLPASQVSGRHASRSRSSADAVRRRARPGWIAPPPDNIRRWRGAARRALTSRSVTVGSACLGRKQPLESRVAAQRIPHRVRAQKRHG